jgi:hypothetical protein
MEDTLLSSLTNEDKEALKNELPGWIRKWHTIPNSIFLTPKILNYSLCSLHSNEQLLNSFLCILLPAVTPDSGNILFIFLLQSEELPEELAQSPP